VCAGASTSTAEGTGLGLALALAASQGGVLHPAATRTAAAAATAVRGRRIFIGVFLRGRDRQVGQSGRTAEGEV
jgi:hypothetical protein